MDLTITLRQKPIENGHTSLYLDIRDKESGKRKFEFLSLWKIARIRSAGNRKKCPLKKRWFQRTLYVCWVGSDCDDNF